MNRITQPYKTGNKWLEAEIVFASVNSSKMKVDDIAEVLGRTPKSVRCKLQQKGISFFSKPKKIKEKLAVEVSKKVIKPRGAKFKINGLFYKVGVHDFVFYYDDFGWVRSSKTIEELNSAIKNIR